MKTSAIAAIISRSLLLLLLPGGHIHAKEEPAGQNPHAHGEPGPRDADAEPPFVRINTTLTYQFEIFSLPKDHAATLLREIHRPGGPTGKIPGLLSEEARITHVLERKYAITEKPPPEAIAGTGTK